MRNRDKAILDSLIKFRVLDRDQLIAIHFADQKQPITTCNRIMNRLALQGLVKVDRTARPYNYFHAESTMKTNSVKLHHFKAIADTYINMRKYVEPTVFEVEVKPTDTKGGIEPDAYAVWNGAPLFIEVQRTTYTKKVMSQKMQRYQDFYDSHDWKTLSDKFPLIMLLSEVSYQLDVKPLKVFQAKDVDHFVEKYMSKK